MELISTNLFNSHSKVKNNISNPKKVEKYKNNQYLRRQFPQENAAGRRYDNKRWRVYSDL